MDNPLIELRNINLFLNSETLLDLVNFKLKKGEIHGLVGPNGAGKSLLMKVLYGVQPFDSGLYKIDGQAAEISSPKDAQMYGISAIFQDMNLVDELTVAENVLLGRYPRNRINKLKWHEINSTAEEILDKLKIDIPVKKLVKNLGYTNKRLIEIAKALSIKSRILILDEPLSAVPHGDFMTFFPALTELKKLGVGIIYISHNLEHILKMSDSISVIRRGRIIKNYEKEHPDLKSLAFEMSGKKDELWQFPKISSDIGRVVMKVDNISTKRRLKNVSFELRKGEILGVAGLVNSGRTALARAIFGLDKLNEGNISIDSHRMKIRSPEDAIKERIGYLPENRLSMGLVSNISIPGNITLSNLGEIVTAGKLGHKKEIKIAFDYINKFRIKIPGMKAKINQLSGGNQQKVQISKWLFSNARILILEEPTHSIDLVSKIDIYNYMRHYVNRGASIILISSDITELVGLSDRILILNSGQICRTYERKDFSIDKILYHAAGGE